MRTQTLLIYTIENEVVLSVAADSDSHAFEDGDETVTPWRSEGAFNWSVASPSGVSFTTTDAGSDSESSSSAGASESSLSLISNGTTTQK